jgi:hypothetical protein
MDIVTLAAVGALVLERIVVHIITATRRCKSRCSNCSSCDLSKGHDDEEETPRTPRMEIPKDL